MDLPENPTSPQSGCQRNECPFQPWDLCNDAALHKRGRPLMGLLDYERLSHLRSTLSHFRWIALGSPLHQEVLFSIG